MIKYSFLVFILFSLMMYFDTYCVIHISSWKQVLLIMGTVQILICIPIWYSWREIYEAVNNDMWLLNIISTIPTSLGCMVGTYLACNQVPNKQTACALLLNVLAVFVSHMK